ncbi:Txe/YoeB family addiction module toxin [Moheibacter lacus]|uniref:Putative mRNA interferase YoeB n=1 Tax=Moheibacter lacus TaxID=2745851 RepID=A0A838ZKT7_9FLAO|nr:Txe/YoeB family addiction module toxin [Moheibacter lacus]MBA5629868.1 Txe/YoeB family addiction module toxin [Moheibacter lacus]
MNYILKFTEIAEKDISSLKKSDKRAFEKLSQLLDELKEHPYSGTGKPKTLKHSLKGLWSRRISKKHRLIYAVYENEITVLIVSAKGHYSDK